MRTFVRLVLALALVTVGLAFSSQRARAEWILDGNPVCTAVGAQSNGRCAPDESGGAVMLWTDERRGPGLIDLYATRILSDGTIAPGWPADGVAIATAGDARQHSIVSDGAGGLLAFWLDDATRHAHVQHVDGSGAFAPGFSAGGMVLPLTVGGPSGWLLFSVTDGAGGALLLWNSYDGTSDRLLMTRLDGTGAFAPGWSAAGVRQHSSDPFSFPSGMVVDAVGPDPSGGALSGVRVSFEDPGGGGGMLAGFARTGPNGGPVLRSGAPYPPTTVAVTVVADGAGGMFTSWWQISGRFVQHVLANGAAAWPSAAQVPVSDLLLRDGNGGVYLLGRSSDTQLELHRRASDASIPAPWTPAGAVVSNAGPFPTANAVVAGGLVYAAWTIGTAPNYDIRAGAVTQDGALAPGWPANGQVLSGAPNARVVTSLIPLPPSDALVVWADTRSGASDVYAARLAPPGPAPLDVPTPRNAALSLTLSPNPAGNSARVSFTLPAATPALLEIVDVTGRVITRLAAAPQGGGQSLALDTENLPGGCYWARLRQGAQFTVKRFAVVH